MSTNFQHIDDLFVVVDDQQAQSLSGGFELPVIPLTIPLSFGIPFPGGNGAGIFGSGMFTILDRVLKLDGYTKFSIGKLSINRVWSFMSGPATA